MYPNDNTEQTIEEWRTVDGFDGLYEVSSCGRVRSLPHVITRKDGKSMRVKGCMLCAKPNGRGYPRVSLCNTGHSTWTHVHSLVAAAFLPKPPGPLGSKRGEYSVNHKDGNKLNNHVENLEYITNLDNILHARRNGLLDVRGSGNGRAKIGPDEVREIRSLYAHGCRQEALAVQFGIDQTSISRIVLRKGWKHIK